MRLLAQLSMSLKNPYRLILVSAAAGYGKSTLLCDWIAQLKIHTAWLSLDENDDNLIRFFTYFIASLQTVDETIGRGLVSALHSLQPPHIESVLIELINQIKSLERMVLLVLDEYQYIQQDAIQESLNFFITHSPDNFRLVILTRSEPQFSLPRLRSRGEILELSDDDLAFTPSEAVSFLHQTMKIKLTEDDCNSLHRQTEGWVSGLQLAALAMRGKTDPYTAIDSLPGEETFIATFMANEVFEQHPEGVKNFLYHTVPLNILTTSLCNAVTGDDNADLMLSYLLENNLFVHTISHEHRLFRYHSLFAGFLMQSLKSTSPHLLREVHRRASHWYETHHFPLDAIQHASLASDFKRLASLLEDHAETLWQNGERTTLLQQFNTLPVSYFVGSPYLAVQAARTLLFCGEFVKAEEYIGFFEQGLEKESAVSIEIRKDRQQSQPNRRELIGMIACLRAGLALSRGDIADLRIHAKNALERLPDSYPGWRSMAAIRLGDALTFTWETRKANEAFREAITCAQKASDEYLAMVAMNKIGKNCLAHGWLHEVEEITRKGILLCQSSGHEHSSMAGSFLILRGIVCCERGQLEDAIRYTNEGIGLLLQEVQLIGVAWGILSQVRVLLASQDIDEAEEILMKLEIRIQHNESPSWISQQVKIWKARVWLAAHQVYPGRLDAAIRILQETKRMDQSEIESFLELFGELTWIRLLMARGRRDKKDPDIREAIYRLEKLETFFEKYEWEGKILETFVLRALAFQEIGKEEAAYHTLKLAAVIAKKEGYIQIFVDEGQPMEQLLYKAIEGGISPAFYGQVLKHFPQKEQDDLGRSKGQGQREEIIEPLSSRELEVLSLIAEGLTNQEIADRLVVSINTIRTHLRNIYGKLGVKSRTQAVASSQTLGIL